MDALNQRESLTGVRILDFSWAAAGPLTTLYAAWLGADIIKVESTHGLDLARRGYYTTVDDLDASPNFHDMNSAKMSIRLNLAHPDGARIARQLASMSDAMVQNFRPGIIEKFGLDYAALSKVKPDIVLLSISTTGQHGPEKDMGGYATTFGALGGLCHITGYQDGPPTEVWDSLDMRLGTTCTFALLTALYHQRKTGEGQHIDLSCREVISTLIGDIFLEYQMTGRVPTRKGNLDEAMAPHNCYPCKGDDKWISIAVATDPEFQALCDVAGHPGWSKDPRFADQHSRWQHQAELDALIGSWTKGHTHYDVMEKLQRVGVAAVPSFNVEELANDPHVQSRGVLRDLPHPVVGEQPVVGPPWKLSETPARIRRHAPLFGEHVDHVFGDLLGLPSREMKRLQADGAFE